MNDRIKLIIESRNLTASKFADEVGVQASSISHILSGRNKPSLEFIQKILYAYPDINYEWLISGKGTMHKEISHPTEHKEAAEAPQEAVNDLFTSSVSPEVNKEKTEKLEDIKDDNNVDNSLKEDENKEVNEVFVEKIQSIKKEKEELPIINKDESSFNKNSAKEVDKVIILYKDKSFDIYQD